MRVTMVDPAGADRTAVSAFIAARNHDPSQHIGYLDEAADDIAGALADLAPGAVFAVGRDEAGDLVGVLGADWDTAVGRAWLYGPFGAGADGLYAALVRGIPAGLEHELYCAAQNARVADFAARHGFRPAGRSLVYELTRERARAQPPATATALTPEYADQFAARYLEIFPTAPYRPETVATREPRPLVEVAGGRLLGFVTLRLTPEFGTGELEHLGVVPEARGRGLGQRLLRAAVTTAFQDPRLRTLVLNTTVTNTTSRRLYERAGFRAGREMLAFRRPPA